MRGLRAERIRLTSILAGGLLSYASAAALAQAPSQAQQDGIRSNCRSDFMKNCSGVTPGGREALECLQQNKSKTSPGCQAALNAISVPPPAAAKPEPAPQPTATAPVVPAPAAAPAGSEAPPPAAKRRAPGPKAATAPARQPPPTAAPPDTAVAPPPGPPRPVTLGEAALIRRFCFTDFRVVCKGVQLGGGRALRCLADNTPALSPGCKAAMANAGN